jgi:NitT/TauT family transport system ATP-binding protein
VIADLEQVSAGSVRVNGMSSRDARMARAYGYVFQAPALFPWRTVLANVCLPLEIHGIAKEQARATAMQHLERVGLTGFEGKYPWQLSGGMQQRVAIARALACRPAVLLMDEPFSAVDALTRVGLQELVRALWRELSLTVVFVTHDVDEGVYLSTRVVALTRAPGAVAADLPIELPHPRNQITTRELPQYLDYRGRLLAQLFADEGLVAMEPA